MRGGRGRGLDCPSGPGLHVTEVTDPSLSAHSLPFPRPGGTGLPPDVTGPRRSGIARAPAQAVVGKPSPFPGTRASLKAGCGLGATHRSASDLGPPWDLFGKMGSAVGEGEGRRRAGRAKCCSVGIPAPLFTCSAGALCSPQSTSSAQARLGEGQSPRDQGRHAGGCTGRHVRPESTLAATCRAGLRGPGPTLLLPPA